MSNKERTFTERESIYRLQTIRDVHGNKVVRKFHRNDYVGRYVSIEFAKLIRVLHEKNVCIACPELFLIRRLLLIFLFVFHVRYNQYRYEKVTYHVNSRTLKLTNFMLLFNI